MTTAREQHAGEHSTNDEHPHSHRGDLIEDPAFSDDSGHDWSSEGGATASGPATATIDDTEGTEEN